MNSLTAEINNPLLLQITDALADGAFIMDATGKITFWSNSLEKLTGFTAREAMGKTCSLLKISNCLGVKGTRDPNKCGVLRGLSTPVSESFIRHKNGHDIPVIKKATVVKSQAGEVNGIIETVTDLSELEKARQTIAETTRRLRKNTNWTRSLVKAIA